MLLPRTCPCCGALGTAPCPACATSLLPPPAALPPPGVDGWRAPLSYEGEGRELVARLKYRNARSSVRWLADRMAALVDPAAVDVVTWAPTTPARRHERGFDQAEVLARAVARRVRRPARRLLRRVPGPPQTGRQRRDRLRGPTFRAAGRPPPRVLVVDDVATTGATLTAAARVLRAAGATEVRVVTAARTPERPTMPHTP